MFGFFSLKSEPLVHVRLDVINTLSGQLFNVCKQENWTTKIIALCTILSIWPPHHLTYPKCKASPPILCSDIFPSSTVSQRWLIPLEISSILILWILISSKGIIAPPRGFQEPILLGLLTQEFAEQF